MYTLEQRMKAVKLYLKYDRNSAAARRGLGYPSRKALRLWVAGYETTGTLHDGYRPRTPKYTEQKKHSAVNYYLEHGRSIRGTVKALGYPHPETLSKWLDEAIEARRQLRTGNAAGGRVKLTAREKEAAVKDLCLREGPARDVAGKYGVTRAALYKWKSDLLGKERPMDQSDRKEPRSNQGEDGLRARAESLKQQVKALQEQVRSLQLERDILEATAEVLKKGQGADPRLLTNREKATVIGALRNKYLLKDLLHGFPMSKSSYFYQRTAMAAGDKYANLRRRVRDAFAKAKGRYGYRRIHAVLTRGGEVISEKVIRRLMREENLVVTGLKKRRYNAYKGEISPAVPNIIERNFRAENPNMKWLTDLTEFHLPAGKVYLSPIIDCFDSLAVSWSIGTRAGAELVNSMLDNAISTLCAEERPVLHSDRGSHYRWPGWIERVEAASLTRSMSTKACTADNPAC